MDQYEFGELSYKNFRWELYSPSGDFSDDDGNLNALLTRSGLKGWHFGVRTPIPDDPNVYIMQRRILGRENDA